MKLAVPKKEAINPKAYKLLTLPKSIVKFIKKKNER